MSKPSAGFVTTLLVGSLAAGGGAGALIAGKKHRGVGFLLGGLLVGPIAAAVSIGLYGRSLNKEDEKPRAFGIPPKTSTPGSVV